MKKFLKISAFLVFFLLRFSLPLYADTSKSASLYSYSGYLTTPDAYINEGQLGFHYSYLPKKVSATKRDISDNRIYSVSLGFLPFLELYFSVFVSPSVKWIYHYGSYKTRSPGVKLKLIKEKKYLPAVAIGIFDPEIHGLGQDSGRDNISSTFIVLSKKISLLQSSVSIGYGTDVFKGKNPRLQGVFGGFKMSLNKNIFIMLDYDTENWSKGIGARWHGIDMVIAVIGSSFPAFRIGYNYNLLNKKDR